MGEATNRRTTILGYESRMHLRSLAALVAVGMACRIVALRLPSLAVPKPLIEELDSVGSLFETASSVHEAGKCVYDSASQLKRCGLGLDAAVLKEVRRPCRTATRHACPVTSLPEVRSSLSNGTWCDGRCTLPCKRDTRLRFESSSCESSSRVGPPRASVFRDTTLAFVGDSTFRDVAQSGRGAGDRCVFSKFDGDFFRPATGSRVRRCY
mmetsp:Transcript_35963/g.121824  ORF Transcript_35963/g.121824 Transcript_35963/m.121824 type:complete len:210 (+) Transcript_35963:24-653(+)